jgi:hypothetical protein
MRLIPILLTLLFASASLAELGLTLVSEKAGDERVYRIPGPDTQRPAKTKSRRAA